MNDDSPRASSSVGQTFRNPWPFRLAAMIFPFTLLAAVELGMRLAGAYGQKGEEWQNPNVEFEKATVFFPRWKDQIAMPKPLGTFRVFALGGSTTFGFGVKDSYPQILELELNERAGGGSRRFEVINGGVPAAGSHRVFEVLKETAPFAPDLVLVFIGHNEFLEDVFFAPDSIVAQQQKLERFTRQFRVVRALSSVLDLSGLAQSWFRRAPLQHHFFGNGNFPLIRSPEQYQARLGFVESNLDLMVGFAGEQRFPIVLMPEVANLMTPPGNSVHGFGFQPSDRWSTLMAEGQQRLDHGEPDGALAALQQASALDPTYAMTHFVSAQALIAKNDLVAARKELDLANALDRRGDRINDDVRRTIVEVATRTATPLLDAQSELYGQPVDVHGPFGRKLYLDHCHPNHEGHRILAHAILRFLADKALVPGLAKL